MKNILAHVFLIAGSATAFALDDQLQQVEPGSRSDSKRPSVTVPKKEVAQPAIAARAKSPQNTVTITPKAKTSSRVSERSRAEIGQELKREQSVFEQAVKANKKKDQEAARVRIDRLIEKLQQ